MFRACLRLAAALIGLAVWATAAVGAISGGKCDGTVVDRIWVGTSFHLGSVATDSFAFIAYYNAARQLTVARVDLTSCEVARRNLPSIVGGWDGHNLTALALDDKLRVHVAANMHNEPLVYFRGQQALDIASLESREMVGRDESNVTYPIFFNLFGNLAFKYRQGRSGNGNWLLNEWKNDRWERMAKPIFSSASASSKEGVSAVPTEFLRGPDGVFHVAVIWRARGKGVHTNFRVSYARTADFVHWFTHDGRPLGLPLTADEMEIVDNAGPDHGLNGPRLSISPSGSPYISYTKYTPSRRNGAYVASLGTDGWHTSMVAESTELHPIQGSLRGGPRIGAVKFGDIPFVSVSFPGKAAYQASITGETLPASQPPADPVRHPEIAAAMRGLSDPLELASVPAGPAAIALPKKFGIKFVWASNRPRYGDQPRQCSVSDPKACNPPLSPLVLVDRRR